ncbi:MAG TPA: methionine--tRNA ligase [Candidatus Poseidoniales archaeon]|nr:MAG TPA: methionine--tRNA ligase [Candidatus Poseidoniales archaeon]
MPSSDHVLICVAWPYANGPLHLGHVAGCYLPPDIQYRYERAKGRRVLMVSGSDEHGTPITVTAEREGISPKDVVDRFHAINTQALADLGCAWFEHVDRRGVEFGGALFNRTTDPAHADRVRSNVTMLDASGLFDRQSTPQFFEVHEEGGRFLPDRYVEGTCPACEAEDARGDQCDACGATYESVELSNPRSKMNPERTIEVRDTEHLFYRLDRFQETLESFAGASSSRWKSNVRAMTKQWLDMGLRPRAVTRDLAWGIPVPFEDEDWDGKCVYVWFEAVQGYLTCAQIWAERHAKEHTMAHEAWKAWWCVDDDGNSPRHLYFLGKDNIPFHTVIWPAIVLGMNMAASGHDQPSLPGPGELALPHDLPAMEYLMLSGGQFSKSRKHAVWLPSFLEHHDPDTLRYYLSINMPENHDTDFTWDDFVEKVNTELIAAFGNFAHRVLTLTVKLRQADLGELSDWDQPEAWSKDVQAWHAQHEAVEASLERHRFKEALRGVMNVAQQGNGVVQRAAPWVALKPDATADVRAEAFAGLALAARMLRGIAITIQPFLPAAAQRLWSMQGHQGDVSEVHWDDAVDMQASIAISTDDPTPLFERLDLSAILEREGHVATSQSDGDQSEVGGVKGSRRTKKKETKNMDREGISTIDFEQFMAVELRVATVKDVEEHPNADRLWVVRLDDGSEGGRTICAGLRDVYTAEDLLGLQVIVVANLAPRKLRGVMSEGMMLAADDENGCVRLLTVADAIQNGSRVR